MDILIGALSLQRSEESPSDFLLRISKHVTLLYLFVFLPIRFVYRVYFDPLSKIPGPKFELVSSYLHRFLWYVYGRRGSLIFRIREWHEYYDSPIIRISPDEVHINDIDTYNQIFKVGTKYPKNAFFYNHPATVGSVLPIRDFHAAHLRRSALQPYFSKQAVRDLEDLVQNKVEKFLFRMSEKEVINLSRGFRCLTADVITTYSYEKCFDALDHPEFSPDFMLAFEELAATVGIQMIFPAGMHWANWFFEDILNRKFLKLFAPHVANALDFTDHCRAAVLKQKKRWDAGERNMSSIFENLFQDDPKKGRKAATTKELTSEAVLTVGAGMDTTGHTLTMATYYLIKHPEIQEKLLEELKTVMPNPSSQVKEDTLEALPYLQACIKEALRFGHGVPGPLPRDVPPNGATILGYDLPPGTVTMNSHYVYHTDPRVYPDPFKFDPERWLAADISELEKSFMPFSRGARICIGMNLAWAELHVGLAKLIRRYEMAFAKGFKDEDMIWTDNYVPIQNGPLMVTAKERTL